MNIKRIIFGIGMALAVLTVLIASATAEDPWVGWLVPQNSSTASSGEDTYVELWITYNRSLQADTTYGAIAHQLDINFDLNCVNITSADFSASPFSYNSFTKPQGTDMVRILQDNMNEFIPLSSGTYKIANLTFHATGSDCCCDIWFDETYVGDEDAGAISNSYQDGTFTCGSVQTFSKSLPAGWNLISLPLTPIDNSVDAVLSGVEQNAVKRYDATSKVFVDVTTTMDPGTAYFVHVLVASTWEYVGTSESSTTTQLKSGLNMIGVPNCVKSVSVAMGSTEYRYAARWNATSQSYEVYNPNAPAAFHGFNTMEPGEGYFVSAKSDSALTISCP